METIYKEGSESKVEFHQDGSGKILAAFVQGDGFERTFFGSKWFQTIEGAKRWGYKQLAK